MLKNYGFFIMLFVISATDLFAQTGNEHGFSEIDKNQRKSSVSLRPRYSEISLKGVEVSVGMKISFVLEVDMDGNVTSGRVIGGNTTTDDQQLIRKILAICKEQLKFAKWEEATQEYYTIVIQPG